MLQFDCQCGKRLKLDDKFAGKRVRCPACGAVTTAPDADEPEPEPPPKQARVVKPASPPVAKVVRAKAVKAAPPPDDDDDDYDDEPRRAPRRKKRRRDDTVSNAGMYIRIAVWGGVAIFAIIVAVILYNRKNEQTPVDKETRGPTAPQWVAGRDGA